MAHIILPLTTYGAGPDCPTATTSHAISLPTLGGVPVLTEPYGIFTDPEFPTEDLTVSPFITIPSGETTGEIAWGVTCGSFIDIRITSDVDQVNYSVRLDGVEAFSNFITGGTVDETIAITPGACGQIVSVRMTLPDGVADQDEGFLTILSVT